MEPQHSANATPTNRWVNRVSCAGRSTPGLAFTVDPTVSSGWPSCLAVAYSGSRAFVPSRHVFDWPALPTGGRPTRPSWVSRFTRYEDGLRLGSGRESHERPEELALLRSGALPGISWTLIDSRANPSISSGKTVHLGCLVNCRGAEFVHSVQRTKFEKRRAPPSRGGRDRETKGALPCVLS
jgi:hypothetical protein